MFDHDAPDKETLADYSGLKIAAVLAPGFLLFICLGKADMGLAIFIVLGVMIVAIKMRWYLRKHAWFWATIVCIFALHVPLFLIARWPQGSGPTLFYTLPVGIADFLLITGALTLAEKLFSNR